MRVRGNVEKTLTQKTGRAYARSVVEKHGEIYQARSRLVWAKIQLMAQASMGGILACTTREFVYIQKVHKKL